jgi:XTP/dITP diphosphohydrolase
MKLLPGTELVLASHNPGKVREIRELLEPYGLVVHGAGELGLPEPEETGMTFSENAALKAHAAADASGHMALADDSGLVVNALDGRPGIYSARWAGPVKDFRGAMARVERELKLRDATDMSAKFVCALALARPHGAVEIFKGEVEGHLEFPPRGDKGFGYDPIFVPDGYEMTFGELDAAKRRISHRARAFAKLAASFEASLSRGTSG